MLARYIRNYCFRISIKSQIKFLKGKFIMNETKQKTASFNICKTVVYSELQNNKYPLCKQSDDKNFEDYLQDFEKSGN